MLLMREFLSDVSDAVSTAVMQSSEGQQIAWFCEQQCAEVLVL